MNLPRLLLADDHVETRSLLRALLQPEFDVVADVQDGRALVQRRRSAVAGRDRHRHLDAGSRRDRGGDRDPSHRTRRLGSSSSRSMAIRCLVERGLSAGALGYVLKLAAGDELVPAVRAALRGERLRQSSPRAPASVDTAMTTDRLPSYSGD